MEERTTISFANVAAQYDGTPEILTDVSFNISAGGFYFLSGASGAGKTTLLRTITGQVRPSAGSIRLGDGADLTRVPVEDMVRRGVALVPEGRGVITELTVDENLRLGGLWRKDRKAAAAVLADMYGLFEPLARRRKSAGHQLSGGERQMLALGRALVSRPRVLTLDEPSLGLAPLVVAQLMATLRDAAARDDMTVLLAEQNITSALSIADRGVVLDLGRVVADAAASTLADDTALRHAYLGF